jgi:hypothetical protein
MSTLNFDDMDDLEIGDIELEDDYQEEDEEFEEEEFYVDLEDDYQEEDEDFEEEEFVPEEVSDSVLIGADSGFSATLPQVVSIVGEYQKTLNFQPSDVGFIMFQQGLANKGVEYHKYLFGSDDINYLNMIHKMFPQFENKPLEKIIKFSDTDSSYTETQWASLLVTVLIEDIFKRLRKKEINRVKSLTSFEDITEYCSYLLSLLVGKPVEVMENKELQNALNNIENVYRYLYKSLFTSGVKGVLTNKGLLYTRDDGSVYLSTAETYKNIHKVILAGLPLSYKIENMGVSSTQLDSENHYLGFNIVDYKPDFDKILKGDNLSLPLWHLACANRILAGNQFSTESEFFKTLLAFFKEGLTTIAKNLDTDAFRSFVKNVCNIVLCVEDGAFHSMYKAYLGKEINMQKIMGVYREERGKIYMGMGDEPHIVKQRGSFCFSLKLVSDKEKFNKVPYFAYQTALELKEQGVKPSLSNMVIGRDLSGDPLTINLAGEDNVAVLLAAAPRGGKGVLTMNILGSAMGAGSPIVYFDGKPDISIVIQELTDKYGVKPITWDAGNGVESSLFPTTYTGFSDPGTPDGRKLRRAQMMISKHITYFKGMQLMLADALMHLNTPYLPDNRPIWVFDELLALTHSLGSVISFTIDLRDKLKKEKKLDSPEFIYTNHLLGWCEDLSSAYRSTMLSEFPKSGIKVMGLYQNIQVKAFKDAIGNYHQYAPYMNVRAVKSPIKLLGKDTFDSEEGLANFKGKVYFKNEEDLIQNAKHFALATSQKVSDVKTFKPYLVIQDLGGSNEREFKNVISKVPGVLERVVDENGNLHPGVSFEGYLDIITDGNIKGALQKSRDYLESVFASTTLGRHYNSVDDYFMDMSLESLQSLEALVDPTLLENISGEGYYSGDEDESFDGEEGFNNATQSTNGVNSFFDPSMLGVKKDTPLTNSVDEDTHSSDVNNPTERVTDKKIPYTPPSVDHAYESVYTEPFIMSERRNPFKVGHLFGLEGLFQLEEMSSYILNDIKRVFGSLDRIHTIKISQSGLIGLNSMAYKPVFSEDFLNTVPHDIRASVQEGNVGHLFNFKHLKKFKYLTNLEVDNVDIAYGNLKRELGLRSFPEIFNKIKSLEYVSIEGKRLERGYTDVASENSYKIKEKLEDTFKIKSDMSFKTANIKKIYDIPVVKTLANTGMWTAGAGLIYASAAAIGGWAIIAGALFGKGAFDYYRGSKNS